MRLIGITGGIGAGKTEVLSFIRQHYLCKICLADEVAHIIQSPGQDCYVKWWRCLEKVCWMRTAGLTKTVWRHRFFWTNPCLKGERYCAPGSENVSGAGSKEGGRGGKNRAFLYRGGASD